MALETYPHTLDSFLPEPSLPPEVLAVLPSESFLQLELAYKITCHAYAQQVCFNGSSRLFMYTLIDCRVARMLQSERFSTVLFMYYCSTLSLVLQVSRLEGEAQEMQTTLGQNQQHIKSLERRLTSMEAEMQEHQQRVGPAFDSTAATASAPHRSTICC